MKWKKFLIAATVVATVMSFCKIFGMPSSEVLVVASRMSKPYLKTIPPSWQGNPKNKDRRFMNLNFQVPKDLVML